MPQQLPTHPGWAALLPRPRMGFLGNILIEVDRRIRPGRHIPQPIPCFSIRYRSVSRVMPRSLAARVTLP